jgi:hypothetical protein
MHQLGARRACELRSPKTTMPEATWLDRLPAWAILASLFAVLVVAAAIGGGMGTRTRRHMIRGVRGRSGEPDEELRSSISTIVAATLGLFAFILAFTFGTAADRYESRRLLVIKDANAIGTTYLRAEMLPEPEAGEVRRLLRDYVELRVHVNRSSQRIEEGLALVDELQRALWVQAKTAAAKAPNPITATFVLSLNELIDLHAERLAVALVNRIPSVIWEALICLGFLAMTLTGYQLGLAKPGPRAGIVLLALGFSMILALNIVIDRPFEGLNVSQAAMENLRRTMTP